MSPANPLKKHTLLPAPLLKDSDRGEEQMSLMIITLLGGTVLKKNLPALSANVEIIQIIVDSAVYSQPAFSGFSIRFQWYPAATRVSSKIINMLWKIPTGVMILIFNIHLFFSLALPFEAPLRL
jgi:hypothetical protein